jgi:hypothetical protein
VISLLFRLLFTRRDAGVLLLPRPMPVAEP